MKKLLEELLKEYEKEELNRFIEIMLEEYEGDEEDERTNQRNI